MKKIILLFAAVVALLAVPSCNSAGHKEADKPAIEQTSYQPSGDLNKDAQAIADMIIHSSQRMIDGEASLEEDQAHADKMIRAYNDYYQSQNRSEEFQKALNEATETAIDSLGVILGKGTR